jgi:hypothetical protein
MVGGHRITGHGTTGIQVTGGTVKWCCNMNVDNAFWNQMT